MDNMDNKHIIMSQKEASRYGIIQKALKKETKGIEAAQNKDGVVRATKEEAEANDAEFDGKTKE
jgi:hypothetical protein